MQWQRKACQTHAAVDQDRQTIIMHMKRGLPCRGEYKPYHRGPIRVFDELHPLNVISVGTEAEGAHFLVGIPVLFFIQKKRMQHLVALFAEHNQLLNEVLLLSHIFLPHSMNVSDPVKIDCHASIMICVFIPIS